MNTFILTTFTLYLRENIDYHYHMMTSITTVLLMTYDDDNINHNDENDNTLIMQGIRIMHLNIPIQNE